MIMINKPKFEVGQLLATPGAIEALQQAGQSIHEFLARHIAGDWGTVCADDAEANEEALKDGSRLLSAYVLKSGVKVWMITEAADERGRVATTLLLPSEY